MNDLALMPNWSAVFLGIFALFAGIGELRRPGRWQLLMNELRRSPALQMTMALIEFLIGALIYMISPWSSPDWLARVMNVLGALMCIEALLILGFSDVYLKVSERWLGQRARLWAFVSVIFGLGLIALALPGFMNG